MEIIILLHPEYIKLEKDYHYLINKINQTEPILTLLLPVWAELPPSEYSDQIHQLITAAEKELWMSRVKLRQLQKQIANIINRANNLSSTTPETTDQNHLS